MLAAHVLDNREKVCSIKFQGFVFTGLGDYNSHLDYLLKSVDDSANGFNRIREIPERDLLLYNGIDSLVEYRVAYIQKGKFS